MIISNSKKYIFFHAPKCGGTSVADFIDPVLAWNDIILGGTEIGELFQDKWAKRFMLTKHSLPSEVKFIIGEDLYERYKKFTVCRNPIGRFISAFNFVQHMLKASESWFLASVDYQKIKDIASIDEFLSSAYFRCLIDKSPEDLTDVERFFSLQSNYVDFSEVSEGRFDIYKLEDLILNADPIRIIAGIDSAVVFPCSNQTPVSSNMTLSCSTIENLSTIYSKDLLLLNYKIDFL